MDVEFPDRWRDLGSFIREQRSTARLSLRRLSELAGISNPYLSQIERGLRRPSAEILQQIARALRISAETLYVQAGILEKPTGEADLARDILADGFLTEEQKQMLIKIYLSFRHENADVSNRLGDGDPSTPATRTPAPETSAPATPATRTAASETAAPTTASTRTAAQETSAPPTAVAQTAVTQNGATSPAERARMARSASPPRRSANGTGEHREKGPTATGPAR